LRPSWATYPDPMSKSKTKQTNIQRKVDVMIHTCNLSCWKTEIRKISVPASPGKQFTRHTPPHNLQNNQNKMNLEVWPQW
jgi:hypothetical protein